MAKFNAEGVEGLELSLKEFSEIPDAVVEEILSAGADVVVKAQREKIRELGLVDTGKLEQSIKSFSKVGRRGGFRSRYFLVYPYGKHGTWNRRAVTKKYKRSKHGRTYTVGGDTKAVTNNDVGFVLEFGAPKRNIKAYQWMRKANESSAAAMVAAQFRVYDEWLKSLNL